MNFHIALKADAASVNFTHYPRQLGDVRRDPSRRFNAGPVADVRGREATDFQGGIELPEKSRLRGHFSVAWIVSQLARAESREGVALSFRTVLPEPF